MPLKNIERVFIIDDEESICLLISAILKSQDIDTKHSTELQGVIEKVVEFNPQVVFLDLSLKDGSGFSIIPDLLSKLTEAEIIIVSAHSGIKERQKAEDLNIKYFIPKPFNRQNILNLLKEIGA